MHTIPLCVSIEMCKIKYNKIDLHIEGSLYSLTFTQQYDFYNSIVIINLLKKKKHNTL